MDKTATLRVARGAVWYDGPQYSRSADWWSSHYSKYSVSSVGFRLVEEVVAPEPAPSASGSIRVFQGSGWNFDPQNARSANRINDAPFRCGRNLGLRLVEEVINEQE